MTVNVKEELDFLRKVVLECVARVESVSQDQNDAAELRKWRKLLADVETQIRRFKDFEYGL